MSATSEAGMAPIEQVVLVPAGGARGAASRERAPARERPGVRLAAFSALGFYGAVRWGSLLSPAPVLRLLGLLAVAVALAAIGQRVTSYRRVVIPVVAVLAVLLILPLAGIPVRWVTHLRIAVTADAIGSGLSAMPGALVPYDGVNEWLRWVIVMGGGLLLVAAGLILVSAPKPLGEGRRAAAALLLVALAIVPSTIVRPSVPYLQGLILFVLVAVFMWGERLRSGEMLMATVLAVLAGAAGMIAAPRLDPHSPWLNYEALAGDLAPGHPEAFDWRQSYGPLHWPRTGHEVLDVQAQHPDYWKAENLDVFDGRGWVDASVEASDPQYTIAPATLARWTQTIHVTLHAMRTSNVIAAGMAAVPQHMPGSLIAGPSVGTWLSGGDLGPGDSYTVSSYDPHPSAAQLETAGTGYPDAILPAYLTLFIPGDPSGPQTAVPQTHVPAGPAPLTFLFPPFGVSSASAYGPSSHEDIALLKASPYGRAYALAQRLKRHATTPYDYVMNVEHYLQHGFRYEEGPSPSAYPLETFLFKTRAGYCQQFAGSMALLLRMGGVPARVAAGFTPGSYNASTHQWVVSDINAHAWVEAWFPGYGWVRFDPTPAAAPALGGHIALTPIKNPGVGGSSPTPSSHGVGTPGTIGLGHHPHGGAGFPVVAIMALAIAAVLLALVLRATVRLRERSEEQLLVELERALARCGRSVGEGTTLASLEQRFRSSLDAAGYIRALRLARFAGDGERPTRAQRRALRGQLRAGLGPAGLLRAWWALPPQLHAYRSAPKPSPGA
jgi:protein-glutamine gamma-glutamyltransferase